MKKLPVLLILFCIAFKGMSQEVINSKGTKVFIDSSKWIISGANIYNKNAGNVGIGVSAPTAQLHTNGSVRFAGVGINTINTKVLTTDDAGNVTTRLFSNLLSGNAVISLNGLTNSVQTFATGTSGSSFNIVSSGNVHTFNLPTASAANSGSLSSIDWSSFNNKVSAVQATTAAAVTTNAKTANVNNTGAYWNANQLQGNSVSSTAPATGQVLNWNGTAWTPTTITHTLSNPANTITSVVNGVSVTAPAVNTVSNTSSANSLTTTVNGLTGTAVNMVNSNTLTQNSSNQLVSTVNGVAASALTANTTGDVTGNLGATVVAKINGAPLGAMTSVSNGQVLTWNGTAWAPAAVPAASTTHTVGTAVNTLTSAVNGVSDTALIVNTVSNTSSANTLTTTVNGVTGSSVNLVNTNTLTQNGTNQLVSTVNGVAATALSLASTGDVTGNLGATVVGKINGSPLGTTTGATSGQFLGWNGSAWVPVSQTPDISSARLSSNFTTTSTSAASSNLTFSIGASESYYVVVEGSIAKSSGTNGVKVAVSVPSGATVSGEVYGGGNALTATQILNLLSANTLTSNAFATGNNVQVPFRMTFTVVNSTTAGNVTIQGAAVSSGTTTIYAGTRMTWTRIGSAL